MELVLPLDFMGKGKQPVPVRATSPHHSMGKGPLSVLAAQRFHFLHSPPLQNGRLLGNKIQSDTEIKNTKEMTCLIKPYDQTYFRSEGCGVFFQLAQLRHSSAGSLFVMQA